MVHSIKPEHDSYTDTNTNLVKLDHDRVNNRYHHCSASRVSDPHGQQHRRRHEAQ